jgi:hypothetical protein
MMVRFRTETGSVYDVDVDNKRVRRVEFTHELRKDGEWRPLHSISRINIGEPVRMLIDVRGDGVITHRTTSFVTEVTGTKD